MTQCKPCITIRDIGKIILSNIKLFYKNVKNDIKSYSNMNAAVCVMDKPSTPVVLHDTNVVSRIREQAKTHYKPE